MRAVIVDIPKHWLAERKSSEIAQWDEMWNGVLHMPPMPNGMHQDLALDMAIFLKRHWARPVGGLVRLEVNLTTPEDEEHWTLNYRIPDLVLLDRARLHIDKNEYMVGAPLVVGEIASEGDETYDKFPFYVGLGVPEVWVIHRDTKVPEVHTLGSGAKYQVQPPGEDGWIHSPATGIDLRSTGSGKLGIRIAGDAASMAELPDS
jgi:Uma2 family endonuclease